MAHRLAARAAGKSVARSVEIADADRLDVETKAISSIETLLADRLDVVAGAVDAVYAGGVDNPSKANVRKITGALDDVLIESIRIYRTHVEGVAAVAIEAVAYQHQLVEQTLSLRYNGTAQAAVTTVDGLLPDMLDDAMARYRRVTDAVADQFTDQLDAAIRYAILSEDTLEHFRRRILSPGPARLPGTSGRGIWWRPLTPMSRSIREGATSIAAGLSSLVTASMNKEIRKR